jgi:hypothetical protein
MGFSAALNPGAQQGVQHSNNWAVLPGQLIGTGIGSIWGAPGLGMKAGANGGQTFGDLLGGNMKGLGLDVSNNLPPGFQAQGMGGILNGLTGLPLANIFGMK